MISQTYSYATPLLDLSLRVDDQLLRFERLAAGGLSWLHPGIPSGLFGVTVNGTRYDAQSLTFDHVDEDREEQGIRKVMLAFRGSSFIVEQHIHLYEDSGVAEFCPILRNTGSAPIRVERIDSLALNIAQSDGEVFYYTGNWGSEYEPHRSKASNELVIESRSGRSSKGNHPWFALNAPGGQVLSASVAWSGNWVFRFEPLEPGGPITPSGVTITGGLHDWEFFKDLQPGESMEGAPVVLALGKDLNAVSQQYARVGRRHWYPRNAFASTLPVEWNHWWPYEDAEINENVFMRNVDVAQTLGFEVCTLDAGWFGPSDAGTFWEHYRGDWHIVNQERFPSGLRKLGEYVHARGMKFGIWCEIEGLGEKARVAIDHPDYPALRDGQRIGYMCFGNPQVQEWAYATLARLITEYGADWIKVDSNFDPGAGCNRTDHGHGAGDGLYAHMRGYYRTLERIHADFPEVVLENCSSGGLRIDLGMMRRTFMTYLSDPDWPVHDLQIFWGASTMLAPDVLLHWTYSHWRHLTPPPYQTFNPRDPSFNQAKWDYYTRISMLGLYGISQKLPELPGWMEKRMGEHNAIYKEHVRRFVKEADLYRLTDQPRRSGEGDRWAAFQYSLPDKSEHLLFVFHMPGAEQKRSIRLVDLDPGRMYHVQGFEGEWDMQMPGSALMEKGLGFFTEEAEGSVLLHLR